MVLCPRSSLALKYKVEGVILGVPLQAVSLSLKISCLQKGANGCYFQGC